MQNVEKQGFPQIAPLGIDGILVRFADELRDSANRAALAFRSAVESARYHGVLETAGSLTAVYVRFDPSVITAEELGQRLADLIGSRDWFAERLPEKRRLWTVPAAYGGRHGPQLASAARQAGLDERAAVAQLSGARLRVMAIGFAPGFPYLGELDPAWDLPRHSDLQTRVPAGALCLALRQAVLFPSGSVTGWHHVAQTAFRSFRPEAEEAAEVFPLSPGDEMVFPAVSAEELDALRSTPDGGATWEWLE